MVTIYSKDYCPYCVRAKALLDSLHVEYKEIDVTEKPDLLVQVSKKSGLQTVPQIFIGDKCLGGYTDIAALHEKGELEKLLK